MKYCFVIRIFAASEATRRHRAWLTVGIVCLLTAAVLELILRNYFGLAFIVPLLYLFKLRAQTSGRTTAKDIETELEFRTEDLTLLYKNTFNIKERAFSEYFVCPYNRISQFKYDDASSTAFLLFITAAYSVIDELGNVSQSKIISNKQIALTLPDYCKGDVLKTLKEHIKNICI